MVTRTPARELANSRWSRDRGAVAKHVDSVIKRILVLTDDEIGRLRKALAERQPSDTAETA